MKKSHRVITPVIVFLSALILEVIEAQSALSATFQYTTISTQTTFTEAPKLVNGIPYDGNFTNIVSFGPFRFEFSGFFSIQSGSLGKAISVKAVQKNPVDRTMLGEAGIAQIAYLAEPEDVASVSGNVRVFPPNLNLYDFIFIPALVAAQQGEPTDLRLGWRVTRVPEPSQMIALSFLAGGLFLFKKQKTRQ